MTSHPNLGFTPVPAAQPIIHLPPNIRTFLQQAFISGCSSISNERDPPPTASRLIPAPSTMTRQPVTGSLRPIAYPSESRPAASVKLAEFHHRARRDLKPLPVMLLVERQAQCIMFRGLLLSSEPRRYRIHPEPFT